MTRSASGIDLERLLGSEERRRSERDSARDFVEENDPTIAIGRERTIALRLQGELGPFGGSLDAIRGEPRLARNKEKGPAEIIREASQVFELG